MSIFGRIEEDPNQAPLYRRRRWRVFLSVLLTIALLGGILVYSRTPIYRAVTTVLTQQPKNLSLFGPGSDTQHLAIQERQLLSQALLQKLLAALHSSYPALDITGLQRRLSVRPIPDTNLLDIAAEGSRPGLLTDLVNTWAGAYESYRIEQIQQASGRTTSELQDQQKQLNTRIRAARDNLAEFRRKHQIVGLKPGDNQALSGLRGLNRSLNKAREQLVDARARQTALADALKRGQDVIPQYMKKRISDLRLALRHDQTRLNQLEQRYTRRYIESDPTLKDLPGQVSSERRDLQADLALARKMAAEDAANAVTEAATAVANLESQLRAQQGKVQQFNDSYQQFGALQAQLTQLQALLNDNQQQLAQIQINNLKKFPPIQIVDPAGVPTIPIRPHYRRDMEIVLGLAFGLALFATWLIEYLNERRSGRATVPRIDLNIYPSGQSLALGAQVPVGQLPTTATNTALSAPAPALPLLTRELKVEEIRTLLTQSQPKDAASIALLLSGVAPQELALVDGQSLDPEQHTLAIAGAQARLLPLPDPTWYWLVPLMEAGAAPAEPGQLDQRLLEIALAERLNTPGAVTAGALWHSYLLYLSRQGIGSEALLARAGRLPAQLLAQLDPFTPRERPADSRVDYLHPALA